MADDAPAPPWRTHPRADPKPALTQRAIVTAALDLVDRRGVDAVNMRSVAQSLGTGPASIYRHIAGKDELLELVLDRVLGEVRTPAPDPADWRRPLRELAYEVHRVLTAHGDIARVAMLGRPIGGNSVRVAEALLAILRTAGFPDRVCGWAVDRLSLYVTADAVQAARDQVGEPLSEQHWAQVADFYRNLPADRFPHTTAMLGVLFEVPAEDRFGIGLDLLLDGLERHLAG